MRLYQPTLFKSAGKTIAFEINFGVTVALLSLRPSVETQRPKLLLKTVTSKYTQLILSHINYTRTTLESVGQHEQEE